MGRTKETWKAFLGSVGLGYRPCAVIPTPDDAEGPYKVTISGDLDHDGRRMEMEFTPERAEWVAHALNEYAAKVRVLNGIYGKKKEISHGEP